MLRPERIEMFRDTMLILKQGSYEREGEQISLKLNTQQMQACKVFLPDDLETLRNRSEIAEGEDTGSFQTGVRNMDAFALARAINAESENIQNNSSILVLNLANPIYPGGGVLRGARAQEEDLCRMSSLYLSLSSDGASTFYRYNRELRSALGSDSIIITPQVEIIKDEKGDLLDDSVIVSVMTCAAPNMTRFCGEISVEEYVFLMYRRIEGMLRVAASLGYRSLILGAFGCGAFENDAKVVSDIFCRVLHELNISGKSEKDIFDRIEFAVLAPTNDSYNFVEFERNFAHYNPNKTQE